MDNAGGGTTVTISKEVQVAAGDEGKRLDFYLAQLFGEVSRSQFKRMIEEGRVKIEGRAVSAHYHVKEGERVYLHWPEKDQSGLEAEDIPLEILAEDEAVILVNKPPGMVVHPAHGNPSHTLVNALLFHCGKLAGRGGAARPGLVHRLDKDTSGIMIIAKTDQAHTFLAKQFKNQTMERVYRVVVKGVVQHEEGICEEAVGRSFLNRKKVIVQPSGGKEAATYFRVIKRFAKATLLEVRPRTGRTHQIRVHMTHLGHPVLGDLFYGIASPWIARQAVHAFALGFIHPVGRQKKYFECPLPEDMKILIQQLEKEKG